MKRAGLVFVFLWFLLGGIAHFALTDLEMRIVPPFIPWPRAVVLISGGFELLGAAGLLVQSTRKAAGIGLFALTLAVTPANVYMLQHPDLFGIPQWVLVLRLPLQVALLALIAWSTGFAARRRAGTLVLATLWTVCMFIQSSAAGAAETIGTVTQVYDGTLTSVDIQECIRFATSIDCFPCAWSSTDPMCSHCRLLRSS